MIKRNLDYLIREATPTEISHGLDWYRDARVFAYSLSKRYNVPFVKVCGVIAALSPHNKWNRNRLDAERLIKFVSSGSPYLPRCNTYKAMRSKAVKILKLDIANNFSVLKVLNGPKISAFFLNIYDGENQSVTVDTWIHLAANLEYLKTEERPVLKKKEYAEIEKVIKELSFERGIKPYQTQAIIWLAFKRKSQAVISANRKAV